MAHEASNAVDSAARGQETLRDSDERLAFLNQLRDHLRSLPDLAQIAPEACRQLGVLLGANRVAYGEIEGEWCTIAGDYVDGVASMAGRFRWAGMAGAMAEEIRRDAVLVVADTGTDARTAAASDQLKALDIAAY